MKPRSPHWQTEGQDPDYRFSLANERTFLAWLRTALALLAGAMLVHQFATRLQPQWLNLALSLALALASVLLSIGAYVRWKGNEQAMRHARARKLRPARPGAAGRKNASGLAKNRAGDGCVRGAGAALGA